jgi:hypothetical protein
MISRFHVPLHVLHLIDMESIPITGERGRPTGHKHDYMLATLPKGRHEIESTEDSTRVVGIYARRGKQSCQPARAASLVLARRYLSNSSLPRRLAWALAHHNR